MLCPHTTDDITRSLSFGSNFKLKCKVDINNMLSTDQTYFYELYIKDSSGDYHEIAIKIWN